MDIEDEPEESNSNQKKNKNHKNKVDHQIEKDDIYGLSINNFFFFK